MTEPIHFNTCDKLNEANVVLTKLLPTQSRASSKSAYSSESSSSYSTNEKPDNISTE